ncbi:MAG TPA: hypothetical protein VJH75_02465 [Patescibacteria group bacterium]|nr:hypothetical protein [Patescibacteria group bacterium]
MAEEHRFTKKSLSDEPPKKRVVRRRRAPVRATPPPEEALPTQKSTPEIDRFLNSVYENDGRRTNLKQIEMKKGHPFLKGFITLIILGGLLAAIAWIGFWVLPGNKNFSENNVSVSFNGPESVTAGEEVTYEIAYSNNEKVALNDVSLVVRYPQGFVFKTSSVEPENASKSSWTIGKLAAQKRGVLEITGVIYRAQGSEQSFTAMLYYKPDNFKSQLQKTATLVNTVKDSPYALLITGADKITVGAETDFAFKIKNSQKNPVWPGLELTPLLPVGFEITSSTPALKDNKWTLAADETASEKIFVLRGKLNETNEEQIKMAAELIAVLGNEKQKIAEGSITSNVVKNAVNLTLAVNGYTTGLNVKPGDNLVVSLRAANLSDNPITNAVVRLNLDAPSINRQSILDWAKVNDKLNGDIKGEQLSETIRRGQITWKSNHSGLLKKLDKSKELVIDVQIPIKEGDRIASETLKENQIKISAEISYTDSAGNEQTVASNIVSLKLNSDLALETRDKILSDSDTSSEYEVTWILTNNLHPLKNIRVEAELFGKSLWQKPESAASWSVNYEEDSKKIVWTIPAMPESVDTLALKYKVTLQEKNPSQNTLISKPKVTAEDTVTGEKIEFVGEEVLLENN